MNGATITIEVRDLDKLKEKLKEMNFSIKLEKGVITTSQADEQKQQPTKVKP